MVNIWLIHVQQKMVNLEHWNLPGSFLNSLETLSQVFWLTALILCVFVCFSMLNYPLKMKVLKNSLKRLQKFREDKVSP